VTRRGGAAVVKHGADEQLARDGRPAPVTRQQRDAGGEAPTGAGAPDGEGGRIEAERVSGRYRPQHTRVGVLDGRGIRMLGCKPVIHRDHDTSGPLAVLGQPPVVLVETAHDHAAAVDPVQAG
jgi:hypothetical protein